MLHLHRSTSADALVAALAGVLADPAPGADPFAPDLLAVGARGTERWIAQRLSHQLGAGQAEDGICARVEFPSPAALLDGVLTEVLQRTAPEHAEAVARWSPQTLTWHVLEVLDELVPAGAPAPVPAGDDVFAVLRHHLRTPPGEDVPRVRRTAVAARLAGLLARCGTARPELLREWAAGRDGSAVEELPADLRWQPEVFRRVREHVGLPAPAELLDDACSRLRAEPG